MTEITIEKKYYSGEAVVKMLLENGMGIAGPRTTRALLEALAALPTADVVEVVRCKDCKYAHKLTDTNGLSVLSCNYQNAHGMLVENHGFCKWAKRREDAMRGGTA